MRRFKVGEYEVIEDLQSRTFKALRHGEEWKELIGDNLIMALIDRIEKLENELKVIEDDKDYKQMAKAFIGETIEDFFCNGFFGSRNFDMAGAEVTMVYDSEDDNAIVIEVKKSDGKYDYGYFDGDWRDWESVYEHLKEWTKWRTG